MKESQNKSYETVLAIVIGLIVLHLYFQIQWLLFASLGLGLASLLFKQLAAGVDWLWFKVIGTIGQVVSFMVLGLIFYLFLFPISFLFRLTNKTKLFSNNKSTTFVERNHTFQPKDLENPW